METLNTVLYNSLKRYYDLLYNVGYVQKKDMIALLIMSYIHDLVTTDYSIFFTDEDKQVFQTTLNCLKNNSCVIFKNLPFPDVAIADEYILGGGNFRIYVGGNADDDTQLYHDNVIKGI